MAANWAGFVKAVKTDPKGVATVLHETLSAVKASDGRLAMSPSLKLELAKIIEMESNWDPSIVNFIGATGLIQFLPSTAKMLGTTTAQIKEMTLSEQAVYVARYFERIQAETGEVKRPGDLYVLTFYPSALHTDDNHVIFAPGTKGWEQNPGLRLNGDGPITTGKVRALATPQSEPPVPFPVYTPPKGSGASDGPTAFGLIVLIVIGLLSSKYGGHGHLGATFHVKHLVALTAKIILSRCIETTRTQLRLSYGLLMNNVQTYQRKYRVVLSNRVVGHYSTIREILELMANGEIPSNAWVQEWDRHEGKYVDC